MNATCECGLHDPFRASPRADVQCPVCGWSYCANCWRECHRCKNTKPGYEIMVREKKEPVPA